MQIVESVLARFEVVGGELGLVFMARERHAADGRSQQSRLVEKEQR